MYKCMISLCTIFCIVFYFFDYKYLLFSDKKSGDLCMRSPEPKRKRIDNEVSDDIPHETVAEIIATISDPHHTVGPSVSKCII